MKINNSLYILSIISDTVNGNDTMHQRRVAVIACNIAEKMGFDKRVVEMVFQAALIHDIGLLDETAKIETFRQIIDDNFKQLTNHALKSAKIARFFNLHPDISSAIELHHTKAEINPSILGSIIFLADNIEVSYRSLSNHFAFNELYDFVAQKSEFFDKNALESFRSLSKCESFWYSIDDKNLDKSLLKILNIFEDKDADVRLEKAISYFLAYLSDSVTIFNGGYSLLMKNISLALAYKLKADTNLVISASLISHIGNIFIPKEIFDKFNEFDDIDYNIVKSHPYYTKFLCERLGFDKNIVDCAALHHENLLKEGYPFKVNNFSKEAKILQVSSVLAACLQDRPYRVALSKDEINTVLNKMAKDGLLDSKVVKEALILDYDKIIKSKDEYYEAVRKILL